MLPYSMAIMSCESWWYCSDGFLLSVSGYKVTFICCMPRISSSFYSKCSCDWRWQKSAACDLDNYMVSRYWDLPPVHVMFLSAPCQVVILRLENAPRLGTNQYHINFSAAWLSFAALVPYENLIFLAKFSLVCSLNIVSGCEIIQLF